VWGRGALDMKGGVAMMLSALLRARAEGLAPAGDVVFCALSDEEGFGHFGAKYMVESHASLFEGVRYAIGEFGGFTVHLGSRRFYPIQVTEKELCTVRATTKGPGGHGALPVHGGAMARMGKLLRTLDRRKLPVHVTPVARDMCRSVGTALPFAGRALAAGLANPALTDRILRLMGMRGRTLDPLFHNTVSPTMLRGSDKVNVIPSEVSVNLDGRLLPGFAPDDLIRELSSVVGEDVELALVQHDPGPAEPDMGMFESLGAILRELDPEGVPVPLLMAGVTDARFFSRLGIQTYGFLPMKLPADFDFWETIHAADERIPVAAVEFGAEGVYRALERFGRSDGERKGRR
jgi:acetylornithine deacetylase/succinyl-diaminopimelate desuccinylase-like protein